MSWADRDPESGPGQPPGVPGVDQDRDVHGAAADLDQAADREIYVMNQSGHGGVLNAAGLARCGITVSTPDITGGHIGRHADGRPDGLIMDAACDLLTGADGVKLGRHGPNLHLPPAPGEADRWLDNAQRAFLAAGVTSLVDAQVSRRELTAYTAALASGRLQVRVGLRVISSYLPELTASPRTCSAWRTPSCPHPARDESASPFTPSG